VVSEVSAKRLMHLVLLVMFARMSSRAYRRTANYNDG
jgi:hypothetical protein